MRLAYCDDEEVQLEYVRHLAEKWAVEKGIPVEFFSYRSAKEFLFENSGGYPFDLLMLDIDMKGMDGMALAREIRKTDEKLPLLFLTNRKEYVYEGYEVAALRYLLKPMTEEKLCSLLDELSGTMNGKLPCFIFSTAGESVKLYLKDLLWIEANGHYLTLHTKEKEYELKKPLSELEQELQEADARIEAAQNGVRFIHTHRSYLVNIAGVERVLRTECVLSDGSRIPISRNSYKAVNEAFIACNMPGRKEKCESLL